MRETNHGGRRRGAWCSFRDHVIGSDLYERGGFPLIEHIDAWATAWPDTVASVDCDDSVFTSSRLLLIRSSGATAVVYVPQCTGRPPEQFWLDDDEAEALSAALQRIRLRKSSDGEGTAD